MAIRIVKLGTDRTPGEGLRVGTVRRPPRGVPKTEFARQNWYDIWYPNLAPSAETMKLGQQADDDAKWNTFAKRFRAEMEQADAARTIALLAKLSQNADFSMGCYCQDESRCHRSILRDLLKEEGAVIVGG
jgi:uncharacterized protein YeaO (DUF488 family)